MLLASPPPSFHLHPSGLRCQSKALCECAHECSPQSRVCHYEEWCSWYSEPRMVPIGLSQLYGTKQISTLQANITHKRNHSICVWMLIKGLPWVACMFICLSTHTHTHTEKPSRSPNSKPARPDKKQSSISLRLAASPFPFSASKR